MATAAIVIDAWKLAIFKKHLGDNHYPFTQFDGPAHGTLTLHVVSDDFEKLAIVVKSANNEAARAGKH